MIRLIFLICTLLVLSCKNQDPPPISVVGNMTSHRFPDAKKKLPVIFARLKAKTLYCGCNYRGTVVDHQSCGYTPKKLRTKKGKRNDRAFRVEWEHVVPAHALGGHFPEWKHHARMASCKNKRGKSIGGRSCAGKLNPEFVRMESDMYNLFPAIGEVNGYRSNYAMTEIPGEPREFGSCDIEIKNSLVEPRESMRGLIARIYFYMDAAYPKAKILASNPSQRRTLEKWNREHPVTPWERRWALEIMKVQGNCNPFVLECKNENLKAQNKREPFP